MKKGVIIIALLFVMALAFTSCKSTQNCPAYGQAEVEQVVYS